MRRAFEQVFAVADAGDVMPQKSTYFAPKVPERAGLAAAVNLSSHSPMTPRQRDRILQNLESVYRDAYDRAKAADDAARMADLDAAFQREQLLLRSPAGHSRRPGGAGRRGARV